MPGSRHVSSHKELRALTTDIEDSRIDMRYALADGTQSGNIPGQDTSVQARLARRLLTAVADRDVSLVKLAMEQRANPNFALASRSHATALHISCATGAVE